MLFTLLQVITLFSILTGVAHAAPLTKRGSSWWLANIDHQGKVPYGNSGDYQIFRNVLEFGAKGDGTTDDTAAINTAISTGDRCGDGCNSSTVSPALVYFPPGKYLVSKPIIQFYYTQLVGDATDPPTLLASADFDGIAVIDGNPYHYDSGLNWYVNQNNFFRQIRNFVIDLTQMPISKGAGIHWQVAQATSLQNIVFTMTPGSGKANQQKGIFMDNGSGGFMSDLTFNGGGIGAFFGSQQFTTRNLTFNNVQIAITMQWNWLWSLKSLNINNCGIGLDMSTGPENQTVGSVTLQDSKILNTPVGIKTAFTKAGSAPEAGGALIIDNVDFTGCAAAIQSYGGDTVLAGNTVVQSWAQGRQYHGSSGSRIQQTLIAPSKPSALLGAGGKIAERSKPQYAGVPSTSFVSVKSLGAKGDGVTDDTAAVQNALNSAVGKYLFFPHGAYVISDTVTVPAGSKIVGEVWSLIMAKGAAFQDQMNPKPVWQIGNPGEVGDVEIQDLIFETIGPQPGAIMMQWNLAAKSGPGYAAMWDVHFRIGGSAGTELEEDKCAKHPEVNAPANTACVGAFLLFHATTQSSAYVENSWLWVADHELDGRSQGSINDAAQISIFNGRGVLIESQKATWLYGTSSEHSVFYQYAILNAKNVFMSAIQTETPYFQGNPDATTPFTAQSQRYFDPNFRVCEGSANPQLCKKSWGLKIGNSQDVLIYSAGLYSFFENYSQDCNASGNCQTNMVHVQNSPSVSLYGLSTFSAVNMVTADGVTQVKAEENKSNFCDTLALWTQM